MSNVIAFPLLRRERPAVIAAVENYWGAGAPYPPPKPHRRSAWVTLAEQGSWTLYERPDYRNPPWINFRAERRGGGTGKRVFWLGCNGRRMALTCDWDLLSGLFPDVAAWIEPRAMLHAADVLSSLKITPPTPTGDDAA